MTRPPADPSPPPPDRLAAFRERRARVPGLFDAHLAADADWLAGEVERLTHLHQLDHSLADQRQAEVDRLRGEVERLRKIQPGLVVVTVGEDVFTADELAERYRESLAKVDRLRAELAREVETTPEP